MCSGAYSSLETAGPVAQSVVSLITDRWFMCLIPALSHNLMEIDLEIFSTAILFLPLIQERLLSVTRNECAQSTG